MDYAIKILKAEKKRLWSLLLSLKSELILYHKKTVYYAMCKDKIAATLKKHSIIDNSISYLKQKTFKDETKIKH